VSSHGERLSLRSGSNRCQPATFRGFRTAPFTYQEIAGYDHQEAIDQPAWRHARTYFESATTHAKEEEIIFLLSQVLLSEGEMKALEKGFEAYDAALGSKSLEDYTALVEQMEAQFNSIHHHE
jgi:hypothetical protein